MISRWRQPHFGIPMPRPVGRDRPGLSVADKRRLQDLLHQQMWCWGRDVLHAAPPGDLLVWAGMTRYRAADAAGVGDNSTGGGSNRYAITLDELHTLSIWAFGVAVTYRNGGGIFLHRYRRGARMLPPGWQPVGLHQPDRLPQLVRPATPQERGRAAGLLDRLMRWIERYERSVLDRLGPDYRRRTLDRWEHPVVEGPDMADEWGRLVRVYRRAASTSVLPFRLARASRSGFTEINT